MARCRLPLLVGIALVLLACFGCDFLFGPKLPEHIDYPPYQERGVREPSIEDLGECQLFFDNTMSMHGFVAAKDSDFILANIALNNTMLTWKKRSYLKIHEDNNWYGQWVPIRTDFSSSFYQRDFYTYLREGPGPLQLIFKDYPTNDSSTQEISDYFGQFKSLSIIVTDLREQEMQIIEVAHRLNEIISYYTDHSAVLFGGWSHFQGGTWTARETVITKSSGERLQMEYSEVNTFGTDNRMPYYIILIGPTDDVLRFADQFGSLVEGLMDSDRLFRQDVLSGGGLQPIDLGETIFPKMVGGPKDENLSNQGIKAGYFTAENTNENLFVNRAKKSDVFPREYKPWDEVAKRYINIYYQLEKQNTNEATLNIYFPLPPLRSDSSQVNYITKRVIDSTMQNQVLCNLITQELWYLKAPSSATSTDGAENTSKTDWIPVPDESVVEYLQTEIFIIKPGGSVLRVEGYEDLEQKQKEKFEIYNPKVPCETFPKTEFPNGVLHLKIRLTNLGELKKEATGGLISIRVPIQGQLLEATETEAWVADFNAPSGSTDIYHTENLSGFLDVLFGKGGSYVEGQQQEEHRTKRIAELAIHLKLVKGDITITTNNESGGN